MSIFFKNMEKCDIKQAKNTLITKRLSNCYNSHLFKKDSWPYSWTDISFDYNSFNPLLPLGFRFSYIKKTGHFVLKKWTFRFPAYTTAQ